MARLVPHAPLVALAAALATLLVASPADANIGPGAGFTVMSSFLVVFVTLLAVVAPAEGIGVRPMSMDALVRTVLPQTIDGRRGAAIRRYAELSKGWPGRFARCGGRCAAAARRRRRSAA